MLTLLLTLSTTTLASTPEELAQRSQDRQHYLAALGAPLEATDRCAQISTEWMQQDCAVMASEALALAGRLDEATAACDVIEQRQLHGFCISKVAHFGEVVGVEAGKLCRNAAAARGMCQSEALERTVRLDTTLPRAVGEEAALREALVAHVEAVLQGARGKRRDQEADRLLAAELAARWADAPLDPSHCGALPAERCAALIGMAIGRSLTELDTLCASELTVQALVAAGAPAVSEAGGPLLLEAGRGLCTPQDRPSEGSGVP